MSNEEDVINHPSHYTQGDIETIDSMVLMFGTDYVSDYCLMTCFKYLERYKYKGNPEQDLNKALWYAEKSYMLRWSEEVYDSGRLSRSNFIGCNDYLNSTKYMIEMAKNDIRALAHMRANENEKCCVNGRLIAHIIQATEGLLTENSQ